MARFGANDVVVRRRPQRWPFVVAALAAPVLFAGFDMYGVTAAIAFVEALVFFMLPALAIESRPVGEKRVPELYADKGGIYFGERLFLRREDIASTAIDQRADGRSAVQLWGCRAKNDLTVVLPDAAERGAQLVDALGLDGDRHGASCYTVERAPLRPAKRQRIVERAPPPRRGRDPRLRPRRDVETRALRAHARAINSS